MKPNAANQRIPAERGSVLLEAALALLPALALALLLALLLTRSVRSELRAFENFRRARLELTRLP